MFLIRFLIVVIIKIFALTFYRIRIEYLSLESKNVPWDKLNLVALLNHTSLYEPLFLGIVPFSLLYRFARYGLFPGAQETLDRPVVGFFFKLMAANAVAISRKRDATWDDFLSHVNQHSLIFLTPEGRMRRPNGLDKFGKPMSVKGGIFDMLSILQQGKMLIVYSRGLHHVQAPGQFFPKLFKEIKIGLELVDIEKILELAKNCRLADSASSLETHLTSHEYDKKFIMNLLDQKRDNFMQSIPL
ncbi:MAG: 1-acyl-sn-glycerol-3-phosphate acyltransferase [Oligoflexales bacterium]|nr:1-acyl-sn-glycerol-3-phosphate acyltransferase [Oligoflexales bacterium]